MKYGITASCFDLFHTGHVLMLEECAEYCDHLTVALQTDPTIDRPKKNKPVQSMFERYVQIGGCRYVDHIIPYDTEEDLLNILKSFTWDIRFIGEEYENVPFTGKDLPGIEIHYNNRKHNFSTTSLRDRIKAG